MSAFNNNNPTYNTGLDGRSTNTMDQTASSGGRQLNENHGIAATGLNEPFTHATAPTTQGTTAERNLDHNDLKFSGPRVATNTVDQTHGNKLTAGQQPQAPGHYNPSEGNRTAATGIPSSAGTTDPSYRDGVGAAASATGVNAGPGRYNAEEERKHSLGHDNHHQHHGGITGDNIHTHGNHTGHHQGDHHHRTEVNDGINRATGEHKYSVDRTGEHDLRNAGAREGDHGASHHQQKNSTSLAQAAKHPIDTAKNMTSGGTSGGVGAAGAVPVKNNEKGYNDDHDRHHTSTTATTGNNYNGTTGSHDHHHHTPTTGTTGNNYKATNNDTTHPLATGATNATGTTAATRTGAPGVGHQEPHAPPRKEGVYEAGGVGGAGAANGGIDLDVPKGDAKGAEKYYSAGGVGGATGFTSGERTNSYPEQRHAGEPLHPGINAGKVEREHETAGNHTTGGADTVGKPSTTDKIKGNLEKLAGKITGNEAKVIKGEEIASGRA